MNVVDAFLMATGWAYLGCLILTIFEKPPMANFKKRHQGLFYIFACTIFIAASRDIFPQYVYFLLGIVWSFATVGSFIGWPQAWMAYRPSPPEQGSAPGQIGMAFWEPAIAVFCFMKFMC